MYYMQNRYFLVLVTLLFVSLCLAQTGKFPVEVTDLLEIKNVGNVALSPDGKHLAYTVVSVIADEKNAGEYRYQSQVWISQTTAPFEKYQFTTAPEGAGQPQWAPNGKRIAFTRGVEGVPQIFIASLTGGEPVQITNMPGGATNPVWSPDGKLIAFQNSMPLRQYVHDSDFNRSNTIPLFSLEKPGIENAVFLKKHDLKPNPNGSIDEVRAYLFKNEMDKKAKVIHKLDFQLEATTSGEMNVTHIFTVLPQAGAKPKAITTGYANMSNPKFIPGSSMLLVEAPYFTKYHPDRARERAIYFIDSSGSAPKALIADSGLVYSGATVSPSGKWVAFQKGQTSFVTIPELYIMQLSPDAKPIKVNYDRNKSNVSFSTDDRFLYFTSPANGGVLLQRYDMRTAQLNALSTTDEGISSFEAGGGLLAYVKNSAAGPSELYVADTENKQPRKISNHNAWVQEKKLSKPEKATFKNELGQEIEYWVMKPTNFEPGKKYPLLLEIHGGPTAMWGPGEASMWHEYQYFCSKGYGVVYCNPRGSGGYGTSFMRSNMNDWGNGPMRDVLTALNKAVEQGWADTSKLLITGGSYAGYLVSYILGHDQRFAAACAQRGVYDLRTFFGEGNAWRLVPNYFGGYPWEKTTSDILERESPINYVQNIQTPLIIFHGEQDLRTGVIQSEQLYKSLKVLNRPVEYVRHPGATHEITRSGNNRQRIDQMLRTWEFFERFVGVR
jgi:dipeptidyl aminopeptidase/acylaminoacyl peptidase